MSTTTKQTKAVKRVSKKEQKVQEQPAVVPSEPVVQEPAPAVPQVKTRKPRVKKQEKEQKVEEKVEVQPVSEEATSEEDKKQRVRRNVSRDSLESDFLSLHKKIEDEIEKLEPEIKYEPRMALDGGKDGLEFYRRIVSGSHKFLKPGGQILFEMNSNKSGEIQKILKDGGFKVEKVIIFL